MHWSAHVHYFNNIHKYYDLHIIKLIQNKWRQTCLVNFFQWRFSGVLQSFKNLTPFFQRFVVLCREFQERLWWRQMATFQWVMYCIIHFRNDPDGLGWTFTLCLQKWQSLTLSHWRHCHWCQFNTCHMIQIARMPVSDMDLRLFWDDTAVSNFDTDWRQIMENIFLRYFWMCSERRTVLSSMQRDFFR